MPPIDLPTGLGGAGFLAMMLWIAFQAVEARRKSLRADTGEILTRLQEENKRLAERRDAAELRVRRLESYIRGQELPVPNGAQT